MDRISGNSETADRLDRKGHKKDKKANKSSDHKSSKHKRDSKKDRKDHKKSSKKDSKKKNEKKDSERDSKKNREDGRDKERRHSPSSAIATMAAVSSSFDGVPITNEDYFQKSQEFRIWLRHTNQKSFEDMTSKEAHELFDQEFVPAYNRGALPTYCYNASEISTDAKQSALHTQHKWNLRLNPSEKDQLQSVSDSIDILTNRAAAQTK